MCRGLLLPGSLSLVSHADPLLSHQTATGCRMSRDRPCLQVGPFSRPPMLDSSDVISWVGSGVQSVTRLSPLSITELWLQSGAVLEGVEWEKG